MSNAIHLLQSQQARDMQSNMHRPMSAQALKEQFKPKLKSAKLQRPKVDKDAINRVLASSANAKREKEKEEKKRKEELLKKRYENDGGAAARRMLANQKATVKIKVNASDADRTKERPAPTSSRLRDEYNADKLTRDLVSPKNKKKDRKRKSESSLPPPPPEKVKKSSKSSSSSSSSSRPRRPGALELLQQIETKGAIVEKPKKSKKEAKPEKPSKSKVAQEKL